MAECSYSFLARTSEKEEDAELINGCMFPRLLLAASSIRRSKVWRWRNSKLISTLASSPEDLLSCHDPSIVGKYIHCFVLEARNQAGKKYPPSTIRSRLSGLNRVQKEAKTPLPILDKSDHRFPELLLTLDTVTSVHHEGVGVTKKSAQIISIEHEELLWKRGVLGWDTPKRLQKLSWPPFCLTWCPRTTRSQVGAAEALPSRYDEYTEFISKNNQHRFKDIHSVNKKVKVYAQPDSDRCIVHLLDCYIHSKLPEDSPGFYLRPLERVPVDGTKPWYCRSRIGVNTLKKFVPDTLRLCLLTGTKFSVFAFLCI